MDISTAAGAPIKWKVGGDWIDFPRLSARLDLPKLAAEIRRRRSEAARALARERRFETVEVYKVLLDVEWVPVKVREIVGWSQTPDGAAFTLIESLRKGGMSQEKAEGIVDAIPLADLVTIAGTVIGAISPAEAQEPDPLP